MLTTVIRFWYTKDLKYVVCFPDPSSANFSRKGKYARYVMPSNRITIALQFHSRRILQVFHFYYCAYSGVNGMLSVLDLNNLRVTLPPWARNPDPPNPLNQPTQL